MQDAPRNDHLTNGNRLLAALSPADFGRLRPNLEHVPLVQKQTLLEPGAPIEHVYFPETGMVSLVTPLDDGAMIEIGMIGREGLVGTPVLLGATTSPAEAMVQLPGSAWRMDSKVLLEEAGRSPALFALLLRYTQALHTQVSQTAACNGRHTLQERLARWLLTAHDRAGDDDLPLRHEFLSMMLGVRRAGVTVAAGALKAAGLIRNSTGRITVLDRRGLEGASCGCYCIVKEEYERLLA